MTKTREVELLEKAAEALTEGRDPLSGDFCYENKVTLDELLDMAEFMSSAIRMMLLWIQRGSKRKK